MRLLDGDAAVTRRDPVLGALLPLVLDAAALGHVVGEGLRIERVRYKHGRSAVASWTATNDTRFGRHGMVVVQSDATKAAKTIEAARRTGAPAEVVDGTRGLVVVAGALADRSLSRTLARLQRDHAHLLTSAALVRHNPLRRQVWRTHDVDGAPVALRVGVDDMSTRHRLLRALAAAEVPVVEPRSAPTAMSELLPWWGCGDLAALDGLTATRAAHAAGRAVSALHRSPGRAGAPGLSSSALGEVAGVAATLVPESVSQVTHLVSAVRQRVADFPGDAVLLHGDLSADQVLVGPDGDVRLVDLDRVGIGPAERDLGSFAAAARLERRGDLLPALLTGYADAGTTWDPRALDAWTAHGLLSRIAEPFRQRDTSWRARWDEVLADVEEVLR